MQWSQKKQYVYVIGSANHSLLLKWYSCFAGKNFENANNLKWDDERRTLRTNYHQYDKSTRQPSSFDVSPLVTTSNLKYSCVKEERKTLEGEQLLIYYVFVNKYCNTFFFFYGSLVFCYRRYI